jgi:DnaJ-class molecular chaperone
LISRAQGESVDDDLRLRLESLAAAIDELDYYEILDVDPDVGHDDVRDAFYRLAGDFHPDRHVGEDAETRARVLAVFKRVSEAYTVLVRPKLRRRYDEALARGERRIGADRPAPASEPKDPASTIQTSMGRQFHRLAMAALAKGDLDAAKLNLSIARSHEGPNEYLDARIREVDEKIAGGAT